MNVHSGRRVHNSMDKKALILQTTLKLITENGFHCAPVSMIASESGIATGTIYRCFKNKEDIINELYTYIKTDFNNAILKGLYDGIGIRDEYYLKWINMVNYHLNNTLESKFLDQYATSPYIKEDVIKRNLEKYSHLRDLYNRAVISGVIKKISYEAITILMLGTVTQIYRIYNSKILIVNEKIISEVFEVFWDGIKQ
jgi:AcrR family transcriptional regulator